MAEHLPSLYAGTRWPPKLPHLIPQHVQAAWKLSSACLCGGPCKPKATGVNEWFQAFRMECGGVVEVRRSDGALVAWAEGLRPAAESRT